MFSYTGLLVSYLIHAGMWRVMYTVENSYVKKYFAANAIVNLKKE